MSRFSHLSRRKHHPWVCSTSCCIHRCICCVRIILSCCYCSCLKQSNIYQKTGLCSSLTCAAAYCSAAKSRSMTTEGPIEDLDHCTGAWTGCSLSFTAMSFRCWCVPVLGCLSLFTANPMFFENSFLKGFCTYSTKLFF